MVRQNYQKWVVRPVPCEHPQFRLLCFPSAGGSASAFRPWTKQLPPTVEVCAIQLPGRQKRIAEPPYRCVAPAVESLAEALGPLLNVPITVFGDCTGAFLAFELCRILRQQAGCTPVHLFVACCRAPQLPPRHSPIHDLALGPLKEKMRRLGVVPTWFLENESCIRELLPVLRADFEMAETYTFSPEPAFSFPLTAFAGNADAISDVDEVRAWQSVTTGVFRFAILDGGHDLSRTHVERMVAEIVRDLGVDGASSPGCGSPVTSLGSKLSSPDGASQR